MSLLDLEFFLASLSILASMRRVNLQICTGPLLATTRVCSSEAVSESRPCWIFSYCILQMRFLDQFALDLRSQRTNQPPGGPVPCTTADVRVTELDEMDIADCCHDFVSLYIDITFQTLSKERWQLSDFDGSSPGSFSHPSTFAKCRSGTVLQEPSDFHEMLGSLVLLLKGNLLLQLQRWAWWGHDYSLYECLYMSYPDSFTKLPTAFIPFGNIWGFFGFFWFILKQL